MQKRTFRRIFEQRKTVIQIVSVEVTWEDDGNPALPEPNPGLLPVIIEGVVRAEGYPAEGYPTEDSLLDPVMPEEDLFGDREGPGGSPKDCSLQDRP